MGHLKLEDHCHAPNPVKADWHPWPIRPGRTNYNPALSICNVMNFTYNMPSKKGNSTNKPKGKAYD